MKQAGNEMDSLYGISWPIGTLCLLYKTIHRISADECLRHVVVAGF